MMTIEELKALKARVDPATEDETAEVIDTAIKALTERDALGIALAEGTKTHEHTAMLLRQCEAERDATRAELATVEAQRKGTLAAIPEIVAKSNATARALAMEEAKSDAATQWKLVGEIHASIRAIATREAETEAQRCLDNGTPEHIVGGIRALATLPPGLVAIEACHICGSTDAVITDRARLCSKGHPVAVPVELVENCHVCGRAPGSHVPYCTAWQLDQSKTVTIPVEEHKKLVKVYEACVKGLVVTIPVEEYERLRAVDLDWMRDRQELLGITAALRSVESELKADVVRVDHKVWEQVKAALGHVRASTQHTHGEDCRGFDDGDDVNDDGSCECGLVSATKAAALLAAAMEGEKP